MYILTPLNNPPCYTWKSFALQNNNTIALSTMILKTKATESKHFFLICIPINSICFEAIQMLYELYLKLIEYLNIYLVLKMAPFFKLSTKPKKKRKQNIRYAKKKNFIITFLLIWTLKLKSVGFLCIVFFPSSLHLVWRNSYRKTKHSGDYLMWWNAYKVFKYTLKI